MVNNNSIYRPRRAFVLNVFICSLHWLLGNLTPLMTHSLKWAYRKTLMLLLIIVLKCALIRCLPTLRLKLDINVFKIDSIKRQLRFYKSVYTVCDNEILKFQSK